MAVSRIKTVEYEGAVYEVTKVLRATMGHQALVYVEFKNKKALPDIKADASVVAVGSKDDLGAFCVVERKGWVFISGPSKTEDSANNSAWHETKVRQALEIYSESARSGSTEQSYKNCAELQKAVTNLLLQVELEL